MTTKAAKPTNRAQRRAQPARAAAPARKSAPAKTGRKAPAKEPDPEPETEATVYDELLELAVATNKKFAEQGSKEKEQDYFHRLLSTVSDSDEEAFEAMSEEAQAWYNDNAEELEANEKYKLTAPDGFGEDDGGEAAEEQVEEDPAPRKSAGKKAAAAPAKKSAAKKGAKKELGAVARIRLAIIANPKLSRADIAALDELDDVNPSTISVTYGWMRDAMADLVEAGWKAPR